MNDFHLKKVNFAYLKFEKLQSQKNDQYNYSLSLPNKTIFVDNSPAILREISAGTSY